jgi:hypothetical protein
MTLSCIYFRGIYNYAVSDRLVLRVAHCLYCCNAATLRNGPLHAVAQQKLMWEALREAVDEEMEADPTVCLMGMSYSFAHRFFVLSMSLYSVFPKLR